MAGFRPSAILDWMDEHLESNRALWDEWAEINARSAFYDLEDFRQGGVRLRDYEIEEVGPIRGKTLLHLQCHFGIDSLSWARLGAKVTGIDFSERAIELATGVVAELFSDRTSASCPRTSTGISTWCTLRGARSVGCRGSAHGQTSWRAS